jgi:hypothetical protein
VEEALFAAHLDLDSRHGWFRGRRRAIRDLGMLLEVGSDSTSTYKPLVCRIDTTTPPTKNLPVTNVAIALPSTTEIAAMRPGATMALGSI